MSDTPPNNNDDQLRKLLAIIQAFALKFQQDAMFQKQMATRVLKIEEELVLMMKCMTNQAKVEDLHDHFSKYQELLHKAHLESTKLTDNMNKWNEENGDLFNA